MKILRTICNLVAVLVNVWGVIIYYLEADKIPDYGLYLIFFFFGVCPWIVVHYLFVFIEYLKPKVESQIQDVQHSKSVKDKNYLVAFSEVEENKIKNKELWAKAFAQCDGDTEKQKSIYVELRTKELSKR